jgi:hypothetical protein
MRTTLDIDNDVLKAAKEIAAARRQTTGSVISELARDALFRPADNSGFVVKDGFPVLNKQGGTVTNALVERLLLEADFEDAGIPLKDDARSARRKRASRAR